MVSAVSAGTFFVEPTELFADAPPIWDCVNALEQAIGPQRLRGSRRSSRALDSKDPKTRATQQAAAGRLHMARSPGFADARERLLMAEKPDSRHAEDYVEYQRAQIAKDCLTVLMSDVWLVQTVFWAQ